MLGASQRAAQSMDGRERLWVILSRGGQGVVAGYGGGLLLPNVQRRRTTTNHMMNS